MHTASFWKWHQATIRIDEILVNGRDVIQIGVSLVALLAVRSMHTGRQYLSGPSPHAFIAKLAIDTTSRTLSRR